MRKAVNYTLNQWKSLRNILKDGAAEISNNLCEQRMKPVKLLLKNCMNIGSEDAAENSAFIFSLIESCKLNGIDPQDYLKHLFECILHGKGCYMFNNQRYVVGSRNARLVAEAFIL